MINIFCHYVEKIQQNSLLHVKTSVQRRLDYCIVEALTARWRLLLHGGGSVCLANLAGLCLHSGDSWCPGVPSFGRGGSRATNFPVFNRVPFSSFSHLRYLLKFKCSALRCSLASTEFSSFNPIAAGLFLPNIRGGGVFRPPPFCP